MDNNELALATMDDDGYGCAITTSRTERRRRRTPEWLHERVNDGYGTGNRHEFWATVQFEDVGPWRVFQRDGSWWMYERRQNAWSTAISSRGAALERAGLPSVDIWA